MRKVNLSGTKDRIRGRWWLGTRPLTRELGPGGSGRWGHSALGPQASTQPQGLAASLCQSSCPAQGALRAEPCQFSLPHCLRALQWTPAPSPFSNFLAGEPGSQAARPCGGLRSSPLSCLPQGSWTSHLTHSSDLDSFSESTATTKATSLLSRGAFSG